MLKLKKIAITGGVASGKTSVCRFFQELGAFAVNADAVVHELLVPNTALGQQVIKQFGSEILENGTINRKVLAEKVFADPEQLEQLEKLLHPAVLCKIEELYIKACLSGNYSAFVVEIPLLFEIGAEGFYDYVVSVLTEESVARRRFEQAGFKQTDYDQRMRRQLNPHYKAAHAHYIIKNNGSLEDLQNQVLRLNQTIMKQP